MIYLNKKIVCVLLSALVVSGSASAKDIYINSEIKNIGPSTTLKTVKTMTDTGWQNINIITADLNDKYLSVKTLLPSGGLSKLENVLSMSERYDVLGAVNSDFFQWAKDGGSPLGTVIKDGTLLSSQTDSEKMATLGIKDAKVIMDYISADVRVSAPNGESITINRFNKHHDLSTPAIYTKDFYPKTPGSGDNITEILISDGKIKKIAKGEEGFTLNDNEYAVRYLPEFNTFFDDNFQEGDSVNLEFFVSISGLSEATGGGTILVKNGEKSKITHDITGKNPRTVAATDKTGSVLSLITIDGRSEKAGGMTLSEVQDFLISQGFYNAINFDGGGSTTMTAKLKDGIKTVNMPTGGNYLRPVAAGIGIVSTAPKDGKLKGFDIYTKKSKVFEGDTTVFYTKNEYDEYENAFSGSLPEITYSVSDEYGYFDKNVFHAAKNGKNVKITASYNGFTAEYYVDILEKPEKISAYPFNFDTNQTLKTVLTGVNQKGETAEIENYSVSDNNISNAGYKELSFSGLKTTVSFTKNAQSFDNLSDFTAKSAGNAITEISSDTKNAPSGKGVKLSYNFNNKGKETKASYLSFNLNVKGKKQGGVYVYSPYKSGQWIRAEFKTAAGEILRETLTESIDYSGTKYLTFKIPENAETLTSLYLVENSLKQENKGYVVFDSLCLFETGEKVSLPSSLDKVSYEKENGGAYFTVMGKMPDRNTLLNSVVIKKITDNADKSKYVWSFDNKDINNIKTQKTNGFSTFEDGENMFLNIDNSGHYITYTQFGKISTALENNKKNLFVFLYEDLSLMKDDAEKEVLLTLIKNNNAENKFVFYPSDDCTEWEEDGIKFVGVGNINVSNTGSFKLGGINTVNVYADNGVKVVFTDLMNR